MQITTKFNVGDLAKHKFYRTGKNSIQALRIMEVWGQTCYGGTQVFYLCRVLFAERKYERPISQDSTYEWHFQYSTSKEESQLGWHKYREDELMELDKETLDIFCPSENKAE